MINNDFGKFIIIIGLLTVAVGFVMQFFPNIPKLPGDIFIKKDSFSFYFPVVTSIIISLILSVIANIFFKK